MRLYTIQHWTNNPSGREHSDEEPSSSGGTLFSAIALFIIIGVIVFFNVRKRE